MEEQKFTKIPEVKEKKPYILMENNVGIHNSDLEATRTRLLKGNSYKDLSTIIIVPTRGMVHAKWVQAFSALMKPMNQKSIVMWMVGMEVSVAYNSAISAILANDDLKNWKYVLSIEDDVLPPPDGLLKLYENIENYDVVGGIYWLKGEEHSQPMIYGNPDVHPKNYIPQIPIPDTIQRCNGMGQGFHLYRMSCFTRMKGPIWFKTLQDFSYQTGSQCMTQDLYFYQEGSKLGFKYACDTRVRCGHYSIEADIVW